MSEPNLSNVPLLEVLCVTAGLVTPEDVVHCFELQRTIYPGTPIGRILVLTGALSQLELARMVAQRQNFRRVFCTTLDNCLGDAPAVQETPTPVAVPELSIFTATELDASPLFGSTQ